MKGFRKGGLKSYTKGSFTEPSRRCGARLVDTVQKLNCAAPKTNHYCLDPDDKRNSSPMFSPIFVVPESSSFDVSSQYQPPPMQGAQQQLPDDGSFDDARKHKYQEDDDLSEVLSELQLTDVFRNTETKEKSQLVQTSHRSGTSGNHSHSEASNKATESPFSGPVLRIGSRPFQCPLFATSNDISLFGEVGPSIKQFHEVHARRTATTASSRKASELPYDDKLFTYSPQNDKVGEVFFLKVHTSETGAADGICVSSENENVEASQFGFHGNSDVYPGYCKDNSHLEDNQGDEYDLPECKEFTHKSRYEHQFALCSDEASPGRGDDGDCMGDLNDIQSHQMERNHDEVKQHTLNDLKRAVLLALAPSDKICDQNSSLLWTHEKSLQYSCSPDTDRSLGRSGKTCFLVPKTSKLSKKKLKPNLRMAVPLLPVTSYATSSTSQQSESTSRSGVSAKTKELIDRMERRNFAHAARSPPSYAPYRDLDSCDRILASPSSSTHFRELPMPSHRPLRRWQI